MDSIRDLIQARQSPAMRQALMTGSERPSGSAYATSSGRQVRIPDDCICETHAGEKIGWIYPSYFEDGSEIPPEHPAFGRAIACACRHAKSQQRYREFLWEQANVPGSRRDGWRFSDYQCSTPEQGAAYMAVMDWASGSAEKRWLFLRGSVGVGKTHLGAAAIAALIGGGVAARYEYVPDLVDYLRNGQIDGRTEARIAQLQNIEALVLDDLAATSSADTEWARGEMLKVVDYRYRERAPLLVTTNSVNLAMWDPRLIDRLQDRWLSHEVLMVWESERQAPHA